MAVGIEGVDLWGAIDTFREMPRPRHRMPAGEALLRSLERQGWRVQGGGKVHFKAYCGCPAMHRIGIATTPSSGESYFRRRRVRLSNHTCWEDDL